MPDLIELSVNESSTVLIEINPSNEYTGIVRAGVNVGEVTEQAVETLADALHSVQPAAETVLKCLTGLSQRPNEIQVEFGLKLSAQAGAIIASGTAEANFVVTLKWTDTKHSPTKPNETTENP